MYVWESSNLMTSLIYMNMDNKKIPPCCLCCIVLRCYVNSYVVFNHSWALRTVTFSDFDGGNVSLLSDFDSPQKPTTCGPCGVLQDQRSYCYSLTVVCWHQYNHKMCIWHNSDRAGFQQWWVNRNQAELVPSFRFPWRPRDLYSKASQERRRSWGCGYRPWRSRTARTASGKSPARHMWTSKKLWCICEIQTQTLHQVPQLTIIIISLPT